MREHVAQLCRVFWLTMRSESMAFLAMTSSSFCTSRSRARSCSPRCAAAAACRHPQTFCEFGRIRRIVWRLCIGFMCSKKLLAKPHLELSMEALHFGCQLSAAAGRCAR